MLTDSAIRAAKPSDKPQRLWDEKGLLLLGTWQRPRIPVPLDREQRTLEDYGWQGTG